MKFAPIMPPGAEHLAVQTGYWLPFATHVLHNRACRDWFAARSVAGDTLIMDTLVYEETDPPLDPVEVRKAYDAIMPTYVIVPDVLNDFDATMVSFWHAVEGPLSNIPRHKLCGAPQGRNYEELKDCTEAMLAEGIGLLGLGRKTFDRAGVSRPEFVQDIEGDLPENVHIHLLGANNKWLDEAALASDPRVLGVDSAQPIHTALAGRSLLHQEAPLCKRPSNYFQLSADDLYDHLSLVRSNIRTAVRWISPLR